MNANVDHAQGFRTGSHSAGYTLTGGVGGVSTFRSQSTVFLAVVCLAFLACTAITRPARADVCDRTEQVRDKLVELTSADDCGSVTAAQLAQITTLDLGNKGIATLKNQDFSGLSSLVRLDLRNNDLELGSFPAGLFRSLPVTIRTIDIFGNPGCPTHGSRCFPPPASVVAAVAGRVPEDLEVRSGENVMLEVVAARSTLGRYVDPLRRGLQYSWKQVSGPTVALAGSDINKTAFIVPDTRTRQTAEFSVTITSASGIWANAILSNFWRQVVPRLSMTFLPPPPNSVASLASLTVHGIGAVYDAGTGTHTATVVNGVSSVAIEAIAREGGASVAIGSNTAQTGTSERNVALETGDNEVTVTVTATDGVTTKTYNLVITRETASGVCGRTEQVRDKLVEETGAEDCGSVTAAQLAEITTLNLNNQGIATLQGNDFSGLTGLRFLYLANNNLTLDSFPAGLFSRLPRSIMLIHVHGNPGCPTGGTACFPPAANLAISAKVGAKARNGLVFYPHENVSLTVTGDFPDPLGRTLGIGEWSQSSERNIEIASSADIRSVSFVVPGVSVDQSADFSVAMTRSSSTRQWPKSIVDHFGGKNTTLTAELTFSVRDRPLNGRLGSVELVEGASGELHYRFDLRLSEPIWMPYSDMRDHAFTVVNGTVSDVRRVKSRYLRHNGRRLKFSDHWRITVRPTAPDNVVTVLLAGNRDCTEPGAICAPDGRPLSNPTILMLGESAEALSVSIADAVATVSDREICFDVTLSRASGDLVAVQFEPTMEGSANVPGFLPGEQYFRLFPPGSVKESVCVALPEVSDGNNGQTVVVRLPYASRVEEHPTRQGNREVPVTIADATAIGIFNASGDLDTVDSLPLATFEDVPERHDGSSAFTVDLRFTGEPPGLTSSTVTGGLIEVTGGSVTGAAPKTMGSTRNWELTVTPSQMGDIGLRLPTRACGKTNAICIDGLPLARAATATVPGQLITGSFVKTPTEHDGSTSFEVHLDFSHVPVSSFSYRTVEDGLFDITGGSIKRVWRRKWSNNQYWAIAITPSGNGAVTIAARATGDCNASHAVCDAAGRKLAGEVSATVPGPATLSVADATVEEAAGATLDFVVTLSRTRSATTTVQYSTSDGTATAGSDYTETRGTLSFGSNETSKTISVPVLDDGHDEGNETLTLTLSNPSGAKLGDATATGTIENNDPMPKAWITRFGRTVGSQVVDAVSERVDASPGTHVTVGGMNLMGAGALPEEEPVSQLRLPDWDERSKLDATTRSMTMDEIVLGSSFHLSAGERVPGHAAFSAWGRFVTGGFEATQDKVTLDGDVTTGMLGADAEWDGLPRRRARHPVVRATVATSSARPKATTKARSRAR